MSSGIPSLTNTKVFIKNYVDTYILLYNNIPRFGSHREALGNHGEFLESIVNLFVVVYTSFCYILCQLIKSSHTPKFKRTDNLNFHYKKYKKKSNFFLSKYPYILYNKQRLGFGKIPGILTQIHKS